MDSRKQTAKPPRHGVAMFVVLGVIVVISMLGFVGLQLAKSDSDQSGNSADMKSQRMTAIGGLNMAVARLQKSDADLVNAINDFKASTGTGSVKEWLDFGGSSIKVTSSDPGYTPLGGDANSGYKVHILGIEAIGTASTLDITLEAFGKGRSGDVHNAVATYRMNGLNSRLSTTSKGPSNAILSTGGFSSSGANTPMDVDGGIYSGGGQLRLQPATGSVTTRIRSSGNVLLNNDITIAENSVVQSLTLNGGSATFQRNLVVLGNLGINRTLTVNGSMIFSGQTVAGMNSNLINVGRDLFVNGSRFVIQGPLTVGTTGSTNSRVWFNAGVNIAQAGTRTINGSVYIRNTDGAADGLRDFTITQDLRYEGSVPGATLRFNTTSITRDFYAEQPIIGGDNSMANGDGLSVGGRSVVLQGMTANNGQSHVFSGNTYWKATSQAGLNGSMTFNGTVSMNGTMASDWAGKWAFGTGPKTWSYQASSCASMLDKLQILNASSNSCRTSAEVVPDWVASTPAVITPTSLGFTAADMDLNPASAVNASSNVNDGNFPSGFLTGPAVWSTLKSKHNAACGIGDAPDAADIKCIYDRERAEWTSNKSGYNGALYAGTDGQHKFLVINITGNWMNMQANQVIPKGVHVMFIINTGLTVNKNWFTNAEGSTQIVYVQSAPTNFGWNGTIYGFLQFNLPTTWDIQLSGDMTLYGALENRGAAQLQPNSGNLKISINDDRAKVVRDEIVMAFTGSSTGSSNDILRFNSDVGVNVTTTPVLTTNDGWVQFERLGEFR